MHDLRPTNTLLHRVFLYPTEKQDEHAEAKLTRAYHQVLFSDIVRFLQELYIQDPQASKVQKVLHTLGNARREFLHATGWDYPLATVCLAQRGFEEARGVIKIAAEIDNRQFTTLGAFLEEHRDLSVVKSERIQFGDTYVEFHIQPTSQTMRRLDPLSGRFAMQSYHRMISYRKNLQKMFEDPGYVHEQHLRIFNAAREPFATDVDEALLDAQSPSLLQTRYQ